MDQLRRLVASLSWTQRISLVLGALVAVGLIMSLSHWNNERDFQPLYSNLSQEDAAAVVIKVRESGTDLRLAEGGSTVLVPSARVAETRLQLAGAGIPHSGRIGFELFDKTNFNTSDFAEQVNYHRALEGELERSIMSITEIEMARVHLTFPKDSIYLDSKQPAKASVLIKLRPGSKLSPQNVAAICQLTASAVEGLAPEAVSVVDMHGNLLNRPRRAGAGEEDTSEAALEYRQRIEKDLLLKINTTLEPLLGADKFRAAVLADCDLTSGEQSEETFDPGKSVMVTSQKTDDMSGGTQAAGVPGSASTLPRPVSRPGSGANNVSRRTESIAYQSSRVVRHMKLPQGNLKRISVSLLIDNTVRWEGTGAKAKKVVEPPTAEKLKRIHDLLVAVIGFSQERGDQLVVDSLPFETTLNATPPVPESLAPAPAHPDQLRDLLKNKPVMIGAGVAAGLVVLLLGVVVILLRRGQGKVKVTAGAAQVSAPAPAPAPDINKQIEAQMAERENLKKQQENEALSALKLAPVTTKKAEVLVKHISEQSKKDSSGLASAVRTWIGDPKKR
jgi:flagellar M-ring protein FliF